MSTRSCSTGGPGRSRPGRSWSCRTPSAGRSGRAAFNAGSKIAARLLDPDPAAEIDAGWFAARLARALALRETLFDAPFYRLVHAEADGLPGVVVDRFGDAAVVQPNAAWAEARLDALVAALREVTGVATVVKNAGGRARGLEGLDDDSAVLAGVARRAGRGADERRDLLRRPAAAGRRPGSSTTSARTTPSPPGSRAGGRARRLRPCRRLRAGGARRRGASRRSRSTARRRRWSSPGAAPRRAGSRSRFAARRGDAFDAMAALARRGAALRARGLRPAGLRAEQGGARGGPARLRAGGAARRGAGRARRLPRALLVQPRRRPRPLPRGEPARRRRGPGGRRRSCTSAAPGPTTRCIRRSPRPPTSRRCSCGSAP